MAAKLLHSFPDDNPDSQKQIAGMLQVFDCQHLLSGKRPSQRRLLPPPSGNSKFNNGSRDADSSNSYNGEIVGSISSKCLNEKLQTSTMSSRPSFAFPLHSSSISSLDGGRTVQSEISPIDHIILPGTPLRDPVINQTRASPRMTRLSVDLPDVIKDSMHRDSHGLSVKAKIKEYSSYHTLKHRDRRRPLQSSKSVNGLGRVGVTGKQDVPTDIKKSRGILFKLHDAPWHYNEKEIPILSYESTNRSHFSMSRDSPRFSYNVRDINTDLKDLSENEHRAGDYNDEGVEDLVQLSIDQPQSSSIVAKLMGLDMLPAMGPASEIHLGPIKMLPIEDHDPSIVPLRVPDVSKPVRVPKSPRRSRRESTSPQCKSADQVMKSATSSKFPIEPAPWKHFEVSRASPKPSQAKRPLEAAKERSLSMENAGHDDQRFGSDRIAKLKSNYSCTSQASGSKFRKSGRPMALESSIVVMKCAKFARKSGIPASSIIPVDGFPGLQTLRIGEFPAHQNYSAINKVTKNQTTRDGCRDQAIISADSKTSNENMRAGQTCSRLSQISKDNKTNSLKNSGSLSPRLQQKKHEFDRGSCPPNPPSDPKKTRKQPNWQSTESGSPGGRRRPNTCSVKKNDDQLNEKMNKSTNMICQNPITNVPLRIRADVEATSNEQPVDRASCQSPSLESFERFVSRETKNDLDLRLGKEDEVGDLSIDPEQPSPVSVLDSSAYMEDSLSAAKQASNTPKGNTITESSGDPQEDLWNTIVGSSTNGTVHELPCKISRKKLQRIDNLVQKLKRLNSTHDESQKDHIASLCESTNPNDRYISEILVTSGLLLRDLTSGLTTFQFHPSGHPINPELFFVLEQTKASSLLAKGETNADTMATTKSKPERLHRKLIFDVVNEILARKLKFVNTPPDPWFKPDKLAKKTLSAQKLLKELCIEIELHQAKKQDFGLEEEDRVKNILREEIMHESDKWMDLQIDLSRIALDVERSIFKDLVNEIVMGEAAALRSQLNRRCRQLFSN